MLRKLTLLLVGLAAASIWAAAAYRWYTTSPQSELESGSFNKADALELLRLSFACSGRPPNGDLRRYQFSGDEKFFRVQMDVTHNSYERTPDGITRLSDSNTRVRNIAALWSDIKNVTVNRKENLLSLYFERTFTKSGRDEVSWFTFYFCDEESVRNAGDAMHAIAGLSVTQL